MRKTKVKRAVGVPSDGVGARFLSEQTSSVPVVTLLKFLGLPSSMMRSPQRRHGGFWDRGINHLACLERALKNYRTRIWSAHPDRGGTDEQAVALNTARDRLIRLFKQKGYTLALLCFTFAASLQATPVTVLWDFPVLSEPDTTFIVYAHTNAITDSNLSATRQIQAGTNLTVTITNLLPGRWFFAATANRNGMQSDISNVLQYETPSPEPEPAPLVRASRLNKLTGKWEEVRNLTNFYGTAQFMMRIPSNGTNYIVFMIGYGQVWNNALAKWEPISKLTNAYDIGFQFNPKRQ